MKKKVKITKYYITRITVDVLSEYPYTFDDLTSLAYDVMEGDCVGHIDEGESQELTPEEMAEKLIEFGSEPDFFQLVHPYGSADEISP